MKLHANYREFHLRTGRDGNRGAGNIYPVDPAAVERLKRLVDTREEQASPRRKPEPAYTFVKTVDRPSTQQARQGQKEQAVKLSQEELDELIARYPKEVVEEAERQRPRTSGRRLEKVFTPDVLEILWEMKTRGKVGYDWIAKENGLLEVSTGTIYARMKKHRIAAQVAAHPEKPEPAQAPSPTPPANGRVQQDDLRSTVAEMATQIDDPQLRSLVRLMSTGGAEVSGTVTFDLRVTVNL